MSYPFESRNFSENPSFDTWKKEIEKERHYTLQVFLKSGGLYEFNYIKIPLPPRLDFFNKLPVLQIVIRFEDGVQEVKKKVKTFLGPFLKLFSECLDAQEMQLIMYTQLMMPENYEKELTKVKFCVFFAKLEISNENKTERMSSLVRDAALQAAESYSDKSNGGVEVRLFELGP